MTGERASSAAPTSGPLEAGRHQGEALPVVKGLWAEVWRVGRREGLGRWKERLLSSGWVVCHVQTIQSKLHSSASVCSRFKVLILLFCFFLFHSWSPDLGMPLSPQVCCNVSANSTSRPCLLFQFPVGAVVIRCLSQILLRALQFQVDILLFYHCTLLAFSPVESPA